LRYYLARGIKVILRGDAAFSTPELMMLCEELGIDYAFRIKENSRLDELVTDAVKTIKKDKEKVVMVYKDFLYQAGSWNKPRRIIAKIEQYPSELFPKTRFIVTSLKWRDKKVVKFYNKRGTCEQWIKEGKYALNWTRLSCQRFVENEARLKLFIMAYNLGNFLRMLALPERIKHWSLRTIQLKMIKIGARLIRHARYYWLLLAETSITEKIFSGLMTNIKRLCPATG
jgi:hypothetical protein